MMALGITLPIAADRVWKTWDFSFHMVPDLPELLTVG
ncbi:MAG: hypothetical protein H6Q99_891 [Proteobacteria bacterium]|nr:hypothetical protein [Pseudomonadota bacterium]